MLIAYLIDLFQKKSKEKKNSLYIFIKFIYFSNFVFNKKYTIKNKIKTKRQ